MAQQRLRQQHHKGVPRTRECRVCIDAGKSVNEYTSHYVKDLDGTVICPTLLNQKCLICGTCGHTASYCNSNAVAAKPIPPTAKPTAKPTARPTSSNKYALLGMMEEEERQTFASFPLLPELEKKPKNTRPATSSAYPPISAIGSWASKLNTPPSPTQDQPCKPARPKPVQISVSWGDQCE